MSNSNEKFYTVVYVETTATTYMNTVRASSPEEAEDIIINRRPEPYTTHIVNKVSTHDSDREIISILLAPTDVDQDDFRDPIS